MALFNNTKTHRPAVTSAVQTLPGPAALNAGGVLGYARNAHSELYLLAVALINLGKDTFHEQGDLRTRRFCHLTHELAVSDPGWMVRMLRWLRTDSHLRSAPLVGAAEFVAARRGMPDPEGDGEQVVDGVLQRADEPGELLAYWSANYGMAFPKALKKGVAAAVLRLYDEYALSKYDRENAAFRFARVLDLTHPASTDPVQRALFAYAHADMRGRNPQPVAELALLRERAALTALPVAERRDVLAGPDATARLRAAGMTWEAVAGWLHGPMDAAAWSAILPLMGYEARLKNLRNFDDAGIDDEAAGKLAAWLTDPQRVAKSRQLPFRFYAAHLAVRSLRWGHTLEKALQASLANVPALPGRTLVLVDQSPSMFPGYHFSTRQQHETISNADLAKLFGSAVALRAADATLVGYGQTSYPVLFHRRDPLLKVMERFRMVDGTDTFGAAAAHYAAHDRVVIVTDEQNNTGRYTTIDQVIPEKVPVYTWNIGGYKVGSTTSGSGSRHTFGGLTDAGFRAVSLIEAGRNADWPF